MITFEYANTLLHYAPDTGRFTWRVSRPPRAKKGAFAGYDNGSGYIKISVDGKRYYAHRLAFLLMGEDIPKEIDHINQNRGDNRWVNLRAADRHLNCANIAGKSGVRSRYGRWYARYADQHLGVFKTKAEAEAARKAAQINAAKLDPDQHIVVAIERPPKTVHIKFLHKGKNLSEWSRITGIPQPTLHYRIFVLKQAPEEALSKHRTK